VFVQRFRLLFLSLCGLCMVLFACPAWAGIYVDNGDGTVTDTSTDLMWQQATAPGTYNLDGAYSYCGTLSFAGYTDWWLPTIDELKSLVATKWHPTIDPTYFPGTAASWYWSSTMYDSYDAWGVDFGSGGVDNYYKYDAGYVRAVRGGQSGLFRNLVISPTSRDVSKDAGTTTFSVSNTGAGTMPWTAAVTSGSSWLSITSGASGTNSETIKCSFKANASTSDRTATILVTATGAAGSPAEVTVTQAPKLAPTPTPTAMPTPTPTPAPTPTPTPVPVLSVSPTNRDVAQDAGTTTFRVSNTGTGTMPWTAAVISDGSWLFIASGARGTNAGTIMCNFATNTSTSVSRTATIRVTATDATGSPVDVTVKQPPTLCSATLDGNLLLHIPYLSSINPILGTISFWADFVFEFNPINPTSTLFKFTNYGIIDNPSFSCEASALSGDLKISIPDLLLADGNTHLWVDMEYSPAFSTNGNTCFVVTKYGVVPN
jgi:hypothetical protein